MTETLHATAIVRAFVERERQERLLSLLGSERGRAKLRRGLAHFAGLDARYVVPIAGTEQSAAGIARLLRARGAPATCVTLAEDAALDGRELDLDGALRQVVGRGMAAFLSCVPGRLAYFEGESPRERYILDREP